VRSKKTQKESVSLSSGGTMSWKSVRFWKGGKNLTGDTVCKKGGVREGTRYLGFRVSRQAKGVVRREKKLKGMRRVREGRDSEG